MISFLHTADWQIGKGFPQFEQDDAAALVEARIQVVERLATIAQERHADAVLVAGDVFDAQTVSDKTIRRLFQAMRGFSGAWCLLPGNHDAALTESVWSRAQRLEKLPESSDSFIFCLTPEAKTIAGKFTLLSAPLTQRHTHLDLTAWFNNAQSDERLPRIGFAHGAVQGILPEGVDSNNPIAANRAQQANLDYLALGDWHGTKQIDERTWYSGTPETDRFKNNDSGQALWVTLESAGAVPQVEIIQTGRYRWQQRAVTLSVPSDVDALAAELEQLQKHDVWELRTQGTCDLHGRRQLEIAVEKAKANARAMVWNDSDLSLNPTEADLQALHADGFIGEALYDLRLQQQGNHADAVLARTALLILARALVSTTLL